MFDFLTKKFSSVFDRITGQDKLTEKNIDQTLVALQDALLEADVPYEVVQKFIKEVKIEALGQKVAALLKPSEQLMKIVYDKVVQFLGGKNTQANFTFDIPSVVMVVGLQGAGKTTTIAKLAKNIRENAESRGKKRKIGFGSVDFYRPAAIDQLEILAKQANVTFYKSDISNPVQASQDIVKKAQVDSCDILFLDTAGRMHIDQEMVNELKQIDAKIKPKYKLLIIDAMTGQESLKVAQAFEKELGFIGAILTKMDSDTRGGLAFAFRYVLNKPILYIAVGEKMQDLEFFRPDRIASRIIGMGDMMSLVEKAQEKIKHNEQEEMYRSLTQGRITLEDFAKQIDMVNKLGSLSTLIKYLPGMGSFNVSGEMIERGEVEIKKFKAIINSMTKKEKIHPKILNTSRKERIAKGAGVAVNEVDLLLSRFEQSQEFVKVFKKMDKR